MQTAKILQRTVTLVLLFAVTASFGVDLTQLDFGKLAKIREAARQFSKKNYEEAQKSFEKLAQNTADDVGKSEFMARAAVAVGMQEGKYESGIEKAKAVEHKPYAVYAQMQLMEKHEKYKDIVAEFKDEVITEWPEDYEVSASTYRGQVTSPQNVKVYAYKARGTAFYETGNGERADQDLSKAADLCKGKGKGDQWLKFSILSTLSKNARERLEDSEKAFAAKRRIVEEITRYRGKSQYMGVVASVASKLREDGKFEEALDTLSKGALRDRPGAGHWFGIGHLGYGRVYAAKAKAQREEAEQLKEAGEEGKAAALLEKAEKNKQKAIAEFTALAEEPKASESHIKAAKKALEDLR